MAKKKKRMKSYVRHSISGLVLLVAIATSAAMSMSRKKVDTVDTDAFKQTVAVFDTKQYEGKLAIRVSGIVEAHREVDIASQVSGTVIKRSDQCHAGSFVEAGTTLLWIDDRNYKLTLDRLKAEKKQAEASIEELTEELTGLEETIKLANREFELQKKETERRQRTKGALSQTELDQASRALTAAKRAVTELENAKRLAKSREARLESAILLSKVRIEEAELNIERCEIKAPFSGVVVDDMVEEGDYVAAGKNVVIFEDTSNVDVKCNLRVEQLAQLIKYQMSDSRAFTDPRMAYELPPTPVTVTREVAGHQREWDGTLTRSGIGLDPQTKMVPCRVVVPDPIVLSEGQNTSPKALVRGMFVNVQIEMNAAVFGDEVLLRMPAIALQPGDYVWAVVDDKLERHKVEVLDRQNENDPNVRKRMVVVRANSKELPANSAIVTSPLAQPVPGTTVKINERFDAKAVDGSVDNESGKDQSDPSETVPGSDGTESTGLEIDSSNANKVNGKTNAFNAKVEMELSRS